MFETEVIVGEFLGRDLAIFHYILGLGSGGDQVAESKQSFALEVEGRSMNGMKTAARAAQCAAAWAPYVLGLRAVKATSSGILQMCHKSVVASGCRSLREGVLEGDAEGVGAGRELCVSRREGRSPRRSQRSAATRRKQRSKRVG